MKGIALIAKPFAGDFIFATIRYNSPKCQDYA